MDSRSWPMLPGGFSANRNVAVVLAGVFKQHMLFFEVVFRQSGGEPKCETFSGFLFERHGCLFWITAGHVISQIRNMIHNANCEIGAAYFLDGMARDRAAMAVDVAGLGNAAIRFERDGFDVGLIQLRPYYKRLILSNDQALPFSADEILRPDMSVGLDGFYIVGSPQTWNRVSVRPHTARSDFIDTTVHLVAAPVRACVDQEFDSHPEEFWNHEECFYGVIDDMEDPEGRTLERIEGVSGGPLLAIEQSQGRLRYFLRGVQSSWLPKRRIVRATDANVIPILIDQVMNASSE